MTQNNPLMEYIYVYVCACVCVYVCACLLFINYIPKLLVLPMHNRCDQTAITCQSPYWSVSVPHPTITSPSPPGNCSWLAIHSVDHA